MANFSTIWHESTLYKLRMNVTGRIASGNAEAERLHLTRSAGVLFSIDNYKRKSVDIHLIVQTQTRAYYNDLDR